MPDISLTTLKSSATNGQLLSNLNETEVDSNAGSTSDEFEAVLDVRPEAIEPAPLDVLPESGLAIRAPDPEAEELGQLESQSNIEDTVGDLPSDKTPMPIPQDDGMPIEQATEQTDIRENRTALSANLTDQTSFDHSNYAAKPIEFLNTEALENSGDGVPRHADHSDRPTQFVQGAPVPIHSQMSREAMAPTGKSEQISTARRTHLQQVKSQEPQITRQGIAAATPTPSDHIAAPHSLSGAESPQIPTEKGSPASVQVEPSQPTFSARKKLSEDTPRRILANEQTQFSRPKTPTNSLQSSKLQTSTVVYKGMGLVAPKDSLMADNQDRILFNTDHVRPSATATAPLQATSTAPHPNYVEARAVTSQMASQFATQPNKSTIIRLDPEELGQVKMTLRSHETNLVLVIAAERPETADLVRRNIQDLAEEFRSLGFENMDFQFEGDAQQPGNQEDNRKAPANVDGDPTPSTPTVNKLPSNAQLNIRL